MVNGRVFVYELGGYGFESRCNDLQLAVNLRYRAYFDQEVSWHSGIYSF